MKSAGFFLYKDSDNYFSKIGLFKSFNICNYPKDELLLLGILILGVVLIFCYFRYRKYRLISRKSNTMELDMAKQSISLQNLTEEKEWLMQEVRHRIKNNLQVVISLLNSQSAYITHPETVQAIKSSQSRIYAIALVHQNLYKEDNLSLVNMECYISELLKYLQDEYRSSQRITVTLKLVSLQLEIASAIQLGLIINEAVNNTLQYAFPLLTNGEIKITLSKDNQSHYLLRIIDNGIGLPQGFDANSNNSLGTSLIRGLSHQLKGELKFENINGAVISLLFKPIDSENLGKSA